jgi:hypothetical protein
MGAKKPGGSGSTDSINVYRLPSDFFSGKAIFCRNPVGFQEKSTQPEGKYGGKMCAGIDSVVPGNSSRTGYGKLALTKETPRARQVTRPYRQPGSATFVHSGNCCAGVPENALSYRTVLLVLV